MLSIVVVTHNRLEYTKQCINAILENTDVRAELIVVDSGSSDKTVCYLNDVMANFNPHPERVYSMTVHELGYNSCADAFNWGFAYARGEFVVRIDNDVLVPEHWASWMVAYMESNPRLAMLTTDLITDLSKESPSVAHSLGISYFTGTVWHNGGLGSWCMAMRKAMMDEVGMYRPLFGPYALQDNDLEKRAMNAGWQIGTLSGMRVGHLYSMETSAEAEYNIWKQGEYQRQIAAWETEWGMTP